MCWASTNRRVGSEVYQLSPMARSYRPGRSSDSTGWRGRGQMPERAARGFLSPAGRRTLAQHDAARRSGPRYLPAPAPHSGCGQRRQGAGQVRFRAEQRLAVNQDAGVALGVSSSPAQPPVGTKSRYARPRAGCCDHGAAAAIVPPRPWAGAGPVPIGAAGTEGGNRASTVRRNSKSSQAVHRRGNDALQHFLTSSA
jgi:hypothetical protein